MVTVVAVITKILCNGVDTGCGNGDGDESGDRSSGCDKKIIL